MFAVYDKAWPLAQYVSIHFCHCIFCSNNWHTSSATSCKHLFLGLLLLLNPCKPLNNILGVLLVPILWTCSIPITVKGLNYCMIVCLFFMSRHCQFSSFSMQFLLYWSICSTFLSNLRNRFQSLLWSIQASDSDVSNGWISSLLSWSEYVLCMQCTLMHSIALNDLFLDFITYADTCPKICIFSYTFKNLIFFKLQLKVTVLNEGIL